MSDISMFDSITLSTIPPNPQAVAGYVGGYWPTYHPLCVKFPKAYHLSIAVSASEDADCLDIEAGDAVPAQAPGWVVRQQHRGVYRPVVYSSVSQMPKVIDALTRGGIARTEVRVWTAHYTYAAHIETGSDGTQWTDHALGRNLDESLLVPDFFQGHVSVPVVNPPHYDRFQQGPFSLRDGQVVNELSIVAEYDKLRKHPLLHGPRLRYLENTCAELAGRIFQVAWGQPDDNCNPSWGAYWRGWRFQQLIHRSQGVRFV